MAERYIKESDIQKRIDDDMSIIQEGIEVVENQATHDAYIAQRIKLINLVCHMDQACDHVYREDIVKDTLHTVHKEIVREYRNHFKGMRGSDLISLNDIDSQMDTILHKVLRSSESMENIINEVINNTASEYLKIDAD